MEGYRVKAPPTYSRWGFFTSAANLARSAVDRSISDGDRVGEVLLELKAALPSAAWVEFLEAEGITPTQCERWTFVARNDANLDANQMERAKAALCAGALRPD